MVNSTRQTIGRMLVRYYLSLRISAAVALPEFNSFELDDPAPIVRGLSGRMRDGWDERELIHDGEYEWIITRDVRGEPPTIVSWN
ncbi:hypothetical protein BH23CHL2_BH23CHL2_28740 [soil metagenome]